MSDLNRSVHRIQTPSQALMLLKKALESPPSRVKNLERIIESGSNRYPFDFRRSGTPVMARGGFMHGMGGFSMHGGHRVGAGGTEGILTPAYVMITISKITDADAFKVTMRDLMTADTPFAGRLAVDMDKPVSTLSCWLAVHGLTMLVIDKKADTTLPVRKLVKGLTEHMLDGLHRR